MRSECSSFSTISVIFTACIYRCCKNALTYQNMDPFVFQKVFIIRDYFFKQLLTKTLIFFNTSQYAAANRTLTKSTGLKTRGLKGAKFICKERTSFDSFTLFQKLIVFYWITLFLVGLDKADIPNLPETAMEYINPEVIKRMTGEQINVSFSIPGQYKWRSYLL